MPQALAGGKPIIAYDFAGADEICLEGQTGFLIRTGDIPTVTNRLLQLASDPALRHQFGQRGQQMVSDLFSVERMVELQNEIYLKLARSRGIPLT